MSQTGREVPADVPLLSLVLRLLRTARGWSQRQLGEAAGISQTQISAYERGDSPQLSLATVHTLVAALGYGPKDISAVHLFLTALGEGASTQGASPVEPSPAELRHAGRLAALAGLAEANRVRGKLFQVARARRAARGRAAAAAACARLLRCPAPDQLEVMEASPDFQTWACAEWLCEESTRAAGDSVEEARRLAALALRVADLAPCSERWRPALRGYCIAFNANAERVAGEIVAAARTFQEAWRLWHSVGDMDRAPLGEWRLHELETSQLRDQGRYAAALEAIDRARCTAPPTSQGRILLLKWSIQSCGGDFEPALATLDAAASLVEASQDPGLVWAFHVNRLVTLCQLERYSEVEAGLPAVRESAIQLGRKIGLTRLVWLTGRVAAGRGRAQEAQKAFEQVRAEFAARGMGYDTALVTLDLALLHLQSGRTGEVVRLAKGMMEIFTSLRVSREALAALRLFLDAAHAGTATVALARDTIRHLEAAERTAAPRRAAEPRGPAW